MRIPTGILNLLHDAGNRITFIGSELATNPKISVPATATAVWLSKWTKDDILKSLSIGFIFFQIIVILPKVPAALAEIYKGIRATAAFVAAGWRGIRRAAQSFATWLF